MSRASEKYTLTDKMEWEELGGGVSRKFLGYDNQIMMVQVKFEEECSRSTTSALSYTDYICCNWRI